MTSICKLRNARIAVALMCLVPMTAACKRWMTGGRAPFNSMGPVVRKMTGWIGDLAARITGKEGDLNSAMLCLSAKFHYYCSDRAKQELAYQVRPLDETITDAWNWFREYDYA